MGRSARQLEAEPWPSPLRSGTAAFFGLIARNPALVGGSTAFLVALSFVSANALWYQPHAHSGAFFATRALPGEWPKMAEPETTIRIERPAAAIPTPKPDPRIQTVQSVLKSLNFYGGTVDGIAGPNTRKAIETYQSKTGMVVTGTVDEALLEQLGASPTTAGIVPSPAPRATVQQASTQVSASADAIEPSQRVVRIQAGLKAFGNDAIQLDGVVGSQTRTAIKEFQSLFGLPETGEPDESVYAKMKEIGLAN